MLRQNYRLLLLFFGLLVFSSGYSQLSDQERASKAKELARLQARINSIVTERNQVRSRYDEVQQALRSTERKIGNYVSKAINIQDPANEIVIIFFNS